MWPFSQFRWAGLLLIVGVVVFSVAVVAAEPFEREAAVPLYTAIAEHTALYGWLNTLTLAGMVILLTGFILIARSMWPTYDARVTASITLLGLAAVLWLVEVIARGTVTVSIARTVVGGAVPPAMFPETIGVGLEALFLAFLTTALAGLAGLIWSLGAAGIVSSRLAGLGAALSVISGSVAAVTYPWLGAVERTLFYPLVVVILPLGIFLIVRNPQHAPAPSS